MTIKKINQSAFKVSVNGKEAKVTTKGIHTNDKSTARAVRKALRKSNEHKKMASLPRLAA